MKPLKRTLTRQYRKLFPYWWPSLFRPQYTPRVRQTGPLPPPPSPLMDAERESRITEGVITVENDPEIQEILDRLDQMQLEDVK
jgi:hypothetical protein